jgi:hypothetical protein
LIVDTQEIRLGLLRDGAVRDAIARRAFLFFWERGYSEPHHSVEDWFRAENEILSVLIEQEVVRRQKIDAATVETAMAEETISTVTAVETSDEASKPKRPAKKTAKLTDAPAAKSAKKDAAAEKPARKPSAKPKAKS